MAWPRLVLTPLALQWKTDPSNPKMHIEVRCRRVGRTPRG
jgi:hypothetical protein